MIRLACLCLSLFFLVACGFHLRGLNELPPGLNNVALIENGKPTFTPLLKRYLAAYAIEINPDPKTANYLLIIESADVQQQMTNVSASTAPRQYLVSYALRFSLNKVKGPQIISSALVRTTRQLTINNDRILGSNAEESQLLMDMRNELCSQLLNRLAKEHLGQANAD